MRKALLIGFLSCAATNSHLVAREALNLMIKRPQDWKNCLKYQVDNAVACSLSPNSPFQPPKLKQANFLGISVQGIPGFSVGSLIKEGEVIPQRPGYKLQYRVIGLPTVKHSLRFRKFQNLCWRRS